MVLLKIDEVGGILFWINRVCVCFYGSFTSLRLVPKRKITLTLSKNENPLVDYVAIRKECEISVF